MLVTSEIGSTLVQVNNRAKAILLRRSANRKKLTMFKVYNSCPYPSLVLQLWVRLSHCWTPIFNKSAVITIWFFGESWFYQFVNCHLIRLPFMCLTMLPYYVFAPIECRQFSTMAFSSKFSWCFPWRSKYHSKNENYKWKVK